MSSAPPAPQPQPQPQKRIAITFDDVPRAPGGFMTPEERTELLIQALSQAKIQQAAFVVTTGNLDKPFGRGGEERIAAYAAAGHVIGNHSHSHRRLSQTPAAEYVADIDRAQAWLRNKPGYRPWFRFPFLDEGGKDMARRDAVRAALAKRGLRNAYVTVDNYDWHLEALAAQATREGKVMNLEALRRLYVDVLVDTANFYDRMAVETLGRSPAHVLLLHETDIAALFIGELASALRANGWQIITADEAYRDPIAAT
ncbi:MAG TPA: polysaccharide deacetylase family protein, partial [Allosphingosinicella sp.]|nr:polysaccharide deacetylase family protein [Allosphingosinicella sp.]